MRIASATRTQDPGVGESAETDMLGLEVDELECAAVARYQSLRALANMIEQAVLRADACTRLDAALARRA
jgi:hypothetical protein